MLKNLIILFLILPLGLFAQSTISGKVVNMVSKKSVAAASVFLSKTSVGNNTTEDGAFTLTNVKNGQYDLVISCLGFETYHQNIQVNNANLKLQPIELEPKITTLNEVVVKYKNDPERDKLLKLFVNQFFGRTDNAAECKLLNPEVLELTRTGDHLTASSGDFLLIENNSLGYKIKYLLKQFSADLREGTVFYTGSYIFEPTTGTADQVKNWEKKRAKTYLGSDMHFLRSCIAENVADEGFKVEKLVRKMNTDRPTDSVIALQIKKLRDAQTNLLDNADSLRAWRDRYEMPKYTETLVPGQLKGPDYIKLTPQEGIYAFGNPDLLVISYKGSKRRTTITFNAEFAPFDNNGVLFNPDSYTFEGYWALQRVADLLPVDYKLPLSL